ncbi:MAG TPA: LysR substrate-binding domain-containing protein, partial [Limnobacter sp.]|nr:LysR substrate-binding domain-containing protein [Limnobacter sp.]
MHQAPFVNLKTIEYQKQNVAELLEQGTIDLAMGVFSAPPRQTLIEHLFEERFVGIVRRGHPALKKGKMSLEKYVQYPHALTTLSRDLKGAIDEALEKHGLKRRIAFATPHMMVLPFTLATTDLIAAVPERIALRLARPCALTIFDLPVTSNTWNVSMIWSSLNDQDEANQWLRKTVKKAALDIERGLEAQQHPLRA